MICIPKKMINCVNIKHSFGVSEIIRIVSFIKNSEIAIVAQWLIFKRNFDNGSVWETCVRFSNIQRWIVHIYCLHSITNGVMTTFALNEPLEYTNRRTFFSFFVTLPHVR